MNPTTPLGSLLDWMAIRASRGSMILPPPSVRTRLTENASNCSGRPSLTDRTVKLCEAVGCVWCAEGEVNNSYNY